MKVLTGIVLSLATATAFAGPIDCRRGVDHKHPACYNYNYSGHHHNGNRNNWVAPVLGGIIVGAVINEASRRMDPPVIVQPVPAPPPVNCSGWREIQYSDGTIVRERICY